MTDLYLELYATLAGDCTSRPLGRLGHQAPVKLMMMAEAVIWLLVAILVVSRAVIIFR